MGVMNTPRAISRPRPVRPARPATCGIPNAEGLCAYRIWDVHELHNESWYEYRDFQRFCETKNVWDLPFSLRDGVQIDLEFDILEEESLPPSFESVMGTETIREYQAQIARRGAPVFVPVEEAKTSYVVLSYETDPAVVSERCFAGNHHYQIVDVEVLEPGEPGKYPDAREL